MNEAQTQLPWWLPDPIIVFFIGFLALMYFMTIRPQQQRMKALQSMMDGLEKGDEVVAAGGIIGRVKEIKGPYVSIEVSENITFKLQKTALNKTSYGAIQDELNTLQLEANSKNISTAVINIRSRKLPNPKELGNSGSFFKNPVLDAEQFSALQSAHPDVPHYPAPSGTKHGHLYRSTFR